MEFWTNAGLTAVNACLTAVLVGVTIFYAVTTRRMFLAQTNPAVRLSVQNIGHGDDIENRIVVENFSPYPIYALKIEYSYCAWITYPGGSKTVAFPRMSRLFECPELGPNGKNCCHPFNDEAMWALGHAYEAPLPTEAHQKAANRDTYLLFKLSFRRRVDGREFCESMPVRVAYRKGADGAPVKVETCWDFRSRLPKMPDDQLGLLSWPAS